MTVIVWLGLGAVASTALVLALVKVFRRGPRQVAEKITATP